MLSMWRRRSASILSILIIALDFSPGSSASAIRGPPVASQQNLQQLARLGDEIKLHCPMQGHPTPMIEWYKGEEKIDHLWTRYRPNKRSLKIKDVDKSDTGQFICRGINGFGKEQIEIDLVVIDPKDFPDLPEGELPDVSPPKLTEETKMFRTTFNKSPEENLKISCSATGKPKPRIVWYKNDHELLENVREKNGKSTLLIRNLMQRDSGRYTCVARNIVGEEKKDFLLNVEEAELIQDPEFPHGPMNRTVKEGETATFDCRVRSSSAPHIKWLKELETTKTVDNMSNVIVVGNKNYRLIHTTRDIPVGRESEYLSQLILSAVDAKDAGTYICFVTNPHGGFNYRPAHLSIMPNSEPVPESPLILILVSSLAVLVVLLLVFITVCVVRRRHKESPLEAGEVRHNLMMPAPAAAESQGGSSSAASHYQVKLDQPLPPTPAGGQWYHTYGGQQAGSGGAYSDASYYSGGGNNNPYEVPHSHHHHHHHHHGGKTPAPSLRYGYTGGYPEVDARSQVYRSQIMPIYGKEGR